MARHPQLRAAPRTVLGKKVKQLRRQGRLPGILYGPVVAQPRPVTVDAREFQEVYQEAGPSTLVDLVVDGETRPVFVREVQLEPVRREVVHIDFYAPNLSQPVVARVPIIVTGELAPGVDGVVGYERQEVEVRALPDQIPHELVVDISELGPANPAILAGDLTLPEGVEMVTPVEEAVVRLEASTIEKELAPEEAAEALAAEEGDHPAAVDQGAEPLEEA